MFFFHFCLSWVAKLNQFNCETRMYYNVLMVQVINFFRNSLELTYLCSTIDLTTHNWQIWKKSCHVMLYCHDIYGVEADGLKNSKVVLKKINFLWICEIGGNLKIINALKKYHIHLRVNCLGNFIRPGGFLSYWSNSQNAAWINNSTIALA